MKHRAVLLIAFAAIVGTVCVARAKQSDARHCADDYQWGLETKGLENCMRRHGDKLTNSCIAALVRTGQVTQVEVDRRRAALGR